MTKRPNLGRLGRAKSPLPIRDQELHRLFAVLEGFERIVLAVSGGADSTALMLLAARWLEGLELARRPHVEVATVDHRLRACSSAEAAGVAAQAARLGFAHAVLVWEGAKPMTGLQAAARAARYALLVRRALDPPADRIAIATAHTEDDQAETLLMRLARGSGIDGLSAMTPCRELDGCEGVQIVRPLLGVAKARLVATLAEAKIGWSEDPSNDCADFERVRVRAKRRELEDIGLTNDKLALSARRLGRARDALEAATAAFLASAVDAHGGVFAEMDRSAFRAQPAEIRVRALTRLLAAFGGAARAARLSQVEALEAALAEAGRVAVTLGGCMVRAGSRAIRMHREPPRARDLAPLAIAPGMAMVWDERFRVSLGPADLLRAAGIATPLTVRSLGPDGYATWARERASGVPAGALVTLPAIWSGRDLVAVPRFGLNARPDAEGPRALVRAEFIGWERPSPSIGKSNP